MHEKYIPHGEVTIKYECGSCPDDTKNNCTLDIDFEPSDPLVDVYISLSKGSYLKEPMQKQYPGYVPFSLLVQKKEGETLTLFDKVEGRSVALKCKQFSPRYGVFEQTLEVLKNSFEAYPKYYPSCTQELLKKRVIDIRTVNNRELITHGLNGFVPQAPENPKSPKKEGPEE